MRENVLGGMCVCEVIFSFFGGCRNRVDFFVYAWATCHISCSNSILGTASVVVKGNVKT